MRTDLNYMFYEMRLGAKNCARANKQIRNCTTGFCDDYTVFMLQFFGFVMD